jgi:hypothetical protein
MNTTKKLITLGLLLVASSSVANAQPSITAGYTVLDGTNLFADVALGGAYLAFQYDIEIPNQPIMIAPMVRIATGTVDDSVGIVNVSLKSAFSAGVKLMFVADAFSFYVAPVYSSLNIEAQWPTYSISKSDSEVGFGAGIRYMFSDNIGAEVSFEKYDNIDVVGGGLVFRF